MPPKKKKGSGKGKKGKGKGAKEVPPNQVPQLDEETKEFFLVQIRDLENRLKRYQKKCDELEVANGEFQKKYDQMESDHKGMVAFWKRQDEQKANEIADLNDRHIGLQQARDSEREDFKKQIQEQRTEYQEMKDQLTSENMILGGKLAALEEFKVQKEDLMVKFAMMEEELAKKDADHKEHLYTLEKKAVMDKDRLKKEMILRVNQVAAEFRKVSNKQMAETTKRTIRENVSINAQLAKMSDKTIELIQENDELKEKERKMKQQIELLEINEKELAKKNHSNLKVIKMLNEKCRNQEAMIGEYEMREQEYQELEAERDILQQQTTSLRDEIQMLAKDNELLEESNQNLEETSKKESQTRAEIEKLFADAAEAIKQSLTSTAPDDDNIDEDQKIAKMQKRDNMLENLLAILKKAASMEIGPLPGEMGKQWEEGSPISPAKKSSVRWDMPTASLGKGSGSLPHYSLGDLGLIPRPDQHITSSLDKMKLSATSSKLGSLRGVLQKSVATQTVSTPKALFYADQIIGKMPESTVLREISSREMKYPPSGSAPKPIPKKLVTPVN